MSPKRDVSSIFNKFAGREVPMTEQTRNIGRHTITEISPANPNDRVNAHIEKAPDGKWRVSNRFDIG